MDYINGKIIQVDVSKLELSDDVPQFKSDCDSLGVTNESRLSGKYDVALAAPIQVWKRHNGDLEVISGRHRLDLAKRSGEAFIFAQVHCESAGFTAENAKMLDIELNVKDGRGKVKDYISYFRGFALSKESAKNQGLLNTSVGRTAYTIAHDGTENLISSHFSGAITDETASSIAQNAPGNESLQNLGLKYIQAGKTINFSVNIMRAAMAAGFTGKADSNDLFGFDDSFALEAEAISNEASKQQRAARKELSAIQGASKNPELAKKGGVEVISKADTDNKIMELKMKIDSLDNFDTNPAIYRQLRIDAGLSVPEVNCDMFGECPSEASQATENARQKIEESDASKRNNAPAETEFFLSMIDARNGNEVNPGQLEFSTEADTEADTAASESVAQVVAQAVATVAIDNAMAHDAAEEMVTCEDCNTEADTAGSYKQNQAVAPINNEITATINVAKLGFSGENEGGKSGFSADFDDTPTPTVAVSTDEPCTPAMESTVETTCPTAVSADQSWPDEYSIKVARYSKNKVSVTTPSKDGYKTRAARLAGTFGRWSNRDNGYIMSRGQASTFARLYADGWDASIMGSGAASREAPTPAPAVISVTPTAPVAVSKPQTIEEADAAIHAHAMASEFNDYFAAEKRAHDRHEIVGQWRSQFVGSYFELIASNDIACNDYQKLWLLVDNGKLTLERACEMIDSAVSAGIFDGKTGEYIKKKIAPIPAPAVSAEEPCPTVAVSAEEPCPTVAVSTDEPCTPAMEIVEAQAVSVPAVQAASTPTIRAKSGAYCAWFFMLTSGAFGLRFAVPGQPDITAEFATWHDRMVAVQSMGQAIDYPPTDSPAAGQDAPTIADSEPVATTAPAVSAEELTPVSAVSTGFERVKPFNLDPLKLLNAGVNADQLIGLGVKYTGHVNNPDGRGAIVSVEDTRGERFGNLRMTCILEDGRVVNAEPHYFTATLRPILQFDGKVHGVPYLSELAMGAAMAKSKQSSSVELAKLAHDKALIDLAVQYPDLKLAKDNPSQGGKLAAVNARIMLKKAFKGVKFSVTSDYNSLSIKWTDGPTDAQVNEIVGRFDIGASDTQSDYFYTVSTAFSDLFGGVQYLTTTRNESNDLVQQAIDALYPDTTKKPTVSDWHEHKGEFSWRDGKDWEIRRMREMLGSISKM